MLTPLILFTRPHITPQMQDFLSDWRIFHAPLSEIYFYSPDQLDLSTSDSFEGLIVTSQAGARWLGEVRPQRWARLESLPCLVVGEKTAHILKISGFQNIIKIFPQFADLAQYLIHHNGILEQRHFLYPTGLHQTIKVTDLTLPPAFQIDQITVYENRACAPNSEFDAFWQAVVEIARDRTPFLAICPQYSKRSLNLFLTQIVEKSLISAVRHCSLVCLSEKIRHQAQFVLDTQCPWHEILSADQPSEQGMARVITRRYTRELKCV